MATTESIPSNPNQTIPYQPDPLQSNPFLSKLAKTFHVSSIPVAIFILVSICICSITILIMTILCIRTFIRKKYIPKPQKKKEKPIFVDDIPGLPKSNDSLIEYGRIEYALNYNLETEELEICVIQANNLLGNSGQEKLSTYAAISLIKYEKNESVNGIHGSGKHVKPIGKQYKTDIIHHSDRPCWNQSFVYKIAQRKLETAVIILEIFDYNENYIDTSLGKLEIPLCEVDHSEYVGKILEKTDWLLSGNPKDSGLGEICVGLGYYPNSSRIDVCVFEARRLILDNYLEQSKSRFMKLPVTELDIAVQLKYNNRLLQKSKTQTRKELTNPYFNEKISFQIKEKHIKDAYVVFQLRQIEKWRYNRILGEVHIGSGASQLKGVKHWDEMLKTPSKLHVRWHPIFPNVSKMNPPFIDWLIIDRFT
ncbi:unnamed protein product [Trichobilharzia regenti]|uniref:C2 domain-containing protein n=1 Tax=Trichobilharzia regenti TaxID=157069 RepID=A0A183VVN9_TRIRE|nr:unnamed protein product [Trichobilharzia regenti]VDQ00425.1 unnamed protein product [Trichobilharzia regenti]